MEAIRDNAGKVAIAVVILAAAAFLLMCRVGGGGPMSALPDKVTYVCVETGKFFTFPRGQAVTLPRENPKTHERTLVPVYKGDDGAWYVSPRRLAVLKQLGEKNKYVDLNTFKVRRPG